MSDDQTIGIYDARAAEYAQTNHDFSVGDPNLAAFITLCPAGGYVLDLGCGPGTHAQVMVQAGLRVDAVDGSAGMIDLASALPGVSARQALFDDISCEDVYDGVWANFSLLHAAKTDFPRHLRRLHRALKPGGVFSIGMKIGQQDGRDRMGRMYSYYTADELEQHVTDAGFTVADRSFGRGKGLDGSYSDWMVILSHG